MNLARQGDVLLRKQAEDGGFVAFAENYPHRVLQAGTATGHSHRFEEGPPVIQGTANGQRYVQLPEGGRLVHEEHDPITFEPGTYVVRIHEEYDPERNQQVMD